MALDEVLKNTIMKNKFFFAFILGIIYSLVGIFTAKTIFGSNPDMMGIAFVTIMLIPAISKALKAEADVEAEGKKFSIKRLFMEHKDIFLIYIALFFGVFFGFLFFTILTNQSSMFYLFKSQLKVAGLTGNAIQPGFFASVLANNMKVLMACLILSLIYGAGSILFITWNASVWGVVFGYSIKEAITVIGQNPFLSFIIILGPALLHIFLEAMSYFSAAIAGGVMSKAAVKESWFSDRFNHVATDSLILFGLAILFVILAALAESRLV